jgi:hypothetical protein
MWNKWLPDDYTRGKMIDKLEVNGTFSEIWEYQRSDGKNCKAIAINHPSRGFSYQNWRPLVEDFIGVPLNQCLQEVSI